MNLRRSPTTVSHMTAISLPLDDHARAVGPPARGGVHLAAFAAFSGSDCHEGLPAMIDELMGALVSAERSLAARFEADLAATASARATATAERRVLAMLAYEQAERGEDAEQAAELGVRALSGGHLLADGARSQELFLVAVVLGLAGRTRIAERVLDEIIDDAAHRSSCAVLAAACGQRGLLRYRRGAVTEALADLQTALGAARGQPWEILIDDGRACLLRVLADRGQLDAAEDELEAWCATGPLPDTPFGNRLLIERGRLRLAQGRLGYAVADLGAAAGRLGAASGALAFEWRGPAARAYYGLGERDRALRLADEDLTLARRWGAARQLGAAGATLGLIEGGATGIERVREAVAILDGSGAHLERARALVTLGSMLRRAGEASEARAQLRAGLELAVMCGASALAHTAEQEIAATGVRRRRRLALSGPEALTPSERRVVELAADGLSNPDIASALFVTRKTVEMHLGNAYRKLHINSRQQLRLVLGTRRAS